MARATLILLVLFYSACIYLHPVDGFSLLHHPLKRTETASSVALLHHDAIHQRHRPCSFPPLQVHKDDDDGNSASVEPTSGNNNKENSGAMQHNSNTNKIDQILSKCTTAFPLFVLSAALLAWTVPNSLLWVNRGNTVTIMLAAVMCGTGLTLQPSDFEAIFSDKRNRLAVPLGVLCQFGIMPASAYAVGQSILATSVDVKNALFLGLCLVGCSPGGTASNLVSLIAGADVALSVLLTSCSTLAAVVMTPLLVKLLVQSTVEISGLALCAATAKVVLLPVVLGMFLKSQTPKLADVVSRFTPFASVVLVALICGGVVSQTAPLLASSGCLKLLLGAVTAVHSIGFLVGYFLPKTIVNEKSSRTICIEVGMQNSALAVVLARSIGAHPAASLPGALSATIHSCLGSILAAFWRLRNNDT